MNTSKNQWRSTGGMCFTNLLFGQPNGMDICNHRPLNIENKIILNTMHALAMGLQSLKMFNFSLGQSPVINVQMHNALARSVAAFTILS